MASLPTGDSSRLASRLASRSFSLSFSHGDRGLPFSSPNNGPHVLLSHHDSEDGPAPTVVNSEDDDEWNQLDDVEADVLFPQYNDDKEVDLAAFGAVVDRKTSSAVADEGTTLKLGRTLSKRSKSYADQHATVMNNDGFVLHLFYFLMHRVFFFSLDLAWTRKSIGTTFIRRSEWERLPSDYDSS